MSAQINACAGEWITEQKCHLPSPENRTNKQAARSSSKLDPAPSGSLSIILGSCNRLQASAKARRLSQATAQILGIFALATVSHFRREKYSLIKTECPHCGFRQYKKNYSYERGRNICNPNLLLCYCLVNQKPSYDPSNVAEAHQLCLLLQINISYLISDESTHKKQAFVWSSRLRGWLTAVPKSAGSHMTKSRKTVKSTKLFSFLPKVKKGSWENNIVPRRQQILSVLNKSWSCKSIFTDN